MKQSRILLLAVLLFSSIVVNAQEKSKNDSKENLHQFYMNLGYAYRLSSGPNELFKNQISNPDHYSTLRNGLQINFAYDYSYKTFFAFGFKASAFNSSNALSSKDELEVNGGVECKDDTYIFYVGPSVKYTFPTFNKNYSTYARGTIGYMSFRNSETTAAIDSTGARGISSTYTGATLGLGLDAGIDYSINDFLSVGFNVGLIGGNVGKLTASEVKKDLKHSENLYRLDFSVGVIIKL